MTFVLFFNLFNKPGYILTGLFIHLFLCPSIIFFKLCKSKMTNIYTHIILLVFRHLMVVNRTGIEPVMVCT